jgi:hypothetical protein
LYARVRQSQWVRPGGTLAGIPALLSAFHWIGSWNPLRFRSPDASSASDPDLPDVERLTRWGQESLGERLSRAQREVLSGLWPERPELEEACLEGPGAFTAGLAQRLEDLASNPSRRALSLPLRLLLNLPVYLYFLFFLTLLFSPALVLLRAWNVAYVPDITGLLTLEAIKVAVIGFIGYYVMALFYVLRKQREQQKIETRSISERFVAELRPFLWDEVTRPLSRFSRALDRLEDRLERIAAA